MDLNNIGIRHHTDCIKVALLKPDGNSRKITHVSDKDLK